MDINVPTDVVDHVRQHFGACNSKLAFSLYASPGTDERTLNDLFISYFAPFQAPLKLASNWMVSINLWSMGGGHHWGAFEVADIAVVMQFRRKGALIRSKLAFLQCKKLWPNAVKANDTDGPRGGLGAVMLSDDEYSELVKPRALSFEETSRYGSYKKDSKQQDLMRHFEGRWGMQMHYLFYNPLQIPHRIRIPLERVPEATVNQVGCRVVRKDQLDATLVGFASGYSPSYGDLLHGLSKDDLGVARSAGWRLEDFAELMLQCKEGLKDDSPNYESLEVLAQQKQRPVATVVSFTFDDVA
jgi:hypothetical protein